MLNTNICPVCGYGMQDPPADYNICPSCGTEFGYNDLNSSIEGLRNAWLQSGAGWWSTVDPIPEGWDPFQQLLSGIYLQPQISLLQPFAGLTGGGLKGEPAHIHKTTRKRRKVIASLPSADPVIHQYKRAA